MRNKIKWIFFLIKLFSIEEQVNNILYNILFLFENEESLTTTEEETAPKKYEIRRDELICKIILCVGLTCWFNLTSEQSGYMILSLAILEVLEYIRDNN